MYSVSSWHCSVYTSKVFKGHMLLVGTFYSGSGAPVINSCQELTQICCWAAYK